MNEEVSASERYIFLQDNFCFIQSFLESVPAIMRSRPRTEKTLTAEAIILKAREFEGDIGRATQFLIDRISVYKQSPQFRSGYFLTLLNWLSEEAYDLPDDAWEKREFDESRPDSLLRRRIKDGDA